MEINEIINKVVSILNSFNRTKVDELFEIKKVIRDSLEFMTFIVRVEEEFGIFIDESHFDHILERDYLLNTIHNYLSE